MELKFDRFEKQLASETLKPVYLIAPQHPAVAADLHRHPQHPGGGR